MAVSYNGNIVLSDLSLCLDAKNKKSYSGTGTTWYDVSGNGNNLTFQNSGSITYNANGYFNTGSTGYFSAASGVKIPTGNMPYCMGVWMRQPSNWGASNGIISIGGYGTMNQSNALRTLANINGQFHHYWWNADLSVTSSSASVGNWFMVIAQFDGTTRTVWVNNILVASDAPSGHNVTSTALQVSLTYPGEYQQGDISAAFIYRRSLTVNELTQNYNAFRGRILP